MKKSILYPSIAINETKVTFDIWEEGHTWKIVTTDSLYRGLWRQWGVTGVKTVPYEMKL